MTFKPILPLIPLSAAVLAVALAQPVLGAGSATVDVKQAGAVGDGKTLNTVVLQKVIDNCSTEGGGTLVFPAGDYLTGTIELKNHVKLRLESGATLLGSPDAADYRNLDPFIDGVGSPMGFALIAAVGATDVGIEGEGTIDGQGRKVKAAQERYTVRPFLIRWVRCSGVSLKQVTLQNPGAWTNHFFQCKDVAVDKVTIRSRDTGLANNDGIDIDSCQSVTVTGCDIKSGDDAICLKATSANSCRDITVNDCKLSTRCNAIKLGTESLGDFEKIRVSNCSLKDIGQSGIALNTVDGGHLHNVVIDGVKMDGVSAVISMRLGARLKTFRAGDVAKPPGILDEVTVRNVEAKGARTMGLLLNGVPGHSIGSVSFENIAIELPGGGTADDAKVRLEEKEASYPEYNMFGKVIPAYGIYARHVRDLRFKNIAIKVVKTDARPQNVFVDIGKLTPAGFGHP